MTVAMTERRTRLLDAAERAVLRDGPDASMATIAAEAGITKPILYREFGDKSGLYAAIAERHIKALLGRLREAIAAHADRRDRTRAVIDAYLRMLEEEPELYRFLMHRAGAEESLRRQLADVVHRLGEELAAGIRIELGLPADDPMALTWGSAMVGAVQAAGDRWLEGSHLPRSVLADQLTELLMGGYAAYPVPGAPARRRTR